MLNIDLREIKEGLAKQLGTVESLKDEFGDSFSTQKRLAFNNLDFHLTEAFNKVNEILNMGGNDAC